MRSRRLREDLMFRIWEIIKGQGLELETFFCGEWCIVEGD